jgi:hypothetical protein
MSHPGLVGRASVIATGQSREALFYGTPALHPARDFMPKPIYNRASCLLGEFVAIIEDVTERESVTPVNFVFGNQVWGVPTEAQASVKAHDPLHLLENLYRRAAEMHARHWCDRGLLKLGWLKGAQWFSGKGRGEWETSILRARQAWAHALKQPAALQFSAKLVSVVEASLSKASWSLLQAHLRNAPFTLCHGDFHSSNMFVRNIPTKGNADHGIIMFDWSEVRCGHSLHCHSRVCRLVPGSPLPIWPRSSSAM